MTPRFLLSGLSLALLLPYGALAQEPSSACAALAGLALADAEVLAAQTVSGSFSAPDASQATPAEVPTFCRVTLRVDPAINIEVWLPAPADWNGRYLAVGGGGLAGQISYNAMIPAIRGGYVTSSTDTRSE